MMRKWIERTFSEQTRHVATLIVRFGLFWSWNALFLLLVGFAFAPYILWDLLLEVADGLVPPNLFVSALFVFAVPAAASIVAIGPLRRQSDRWLTLMYGLEGPLFALALFRLFLLRDMTPAAAEVLGIVGLGILAFGHGFVTGVLPSTRLGAIVRSVGAGFSVSTALYLGAILAFYSLPVGLWLLRGFLAMDWLRELGRAIAQSHGTAIIWLPMAMFVFFYAATVLVVLPFVMVWLYGRQGVQVFRGARPILGAVPVVLLMLAVPVGAEVLYRVLGTQRQTAAFAALEPGGQAGVQRGEADRRALRARAEEIRAGLLNAYLAPYRYLGAIGSNDHIRSLYERDARLPKAFAVSMQDAYNVLAAPFLYRGESLSADQARAERLYEEFFDTPLQKGERAPILAALSATYDRDQRQAGLLNIGQRKVWLAQQDVHVQTHGDFASVELHEVYENQTVEQQEIFYYFSLPESAVITGLWLGDTDQRGKRFAHAVAPRGAAQRVYNREVARRADPALLEQVGPRQYRLRAFPIPPRQRLARRAALVSDPAAPPPILHLWLTYDTLAIDGAWPLPALRERRNVYATAGSVRSVRVDQGAPQPLRLASGEGWLPPAVTRVEAGLPGAHQIDFPDGNTTTPGVLQVRAVPAEPNPAPPRGQTLAVVVDRSYSMARHAAEVQAVLQTLQRQVQGPNQVHLYLSAPTAWGEPATRVEDLARFDAGSLTYFGGGRVGDLVRQFALLRGAQEYRAVIVITDDGSMDLADDKTPIVDFHAPVFFLHVGGTLAAGYDDATLATIQRRGGTSVTALQPILARVAAGGVPVPGVAVPAQGTAGPVAVTLLDETIDGYRWTVTAGPAGGGSASSGGAASVAPSGDPFVALAARVLILAQMRALDHGLPTALDTMHRIAKAHSQVSPYSSLIVLVNDEQREALRRAEQEKDRFDRQVETGKEQLTKPSELMVSGVPEPEEWLLIAVVAGALAVACYRRRLGSSGQPPAASAA